MRRITLSDITMQYSGKGSVRLTFREKLRLAEMLDGLGVSSVETPRFQDRLTDGLLLKSLSTAVKEAVLTVPVPAGDGETLQYIADCLREAKRPRLQVSLPVSAVQMEYLFHKKPEAMLALIGESVSACARLCENVEFCAEDAGRSDEAFLLEALKTAVAAGASSVTYCDTAGDRLPEELAAAVRTLRAALPETPLGVRISNDVYMADAGAAHAVLAGADEIKVAAVGSETTSLKRFATLLFSRGDTLGAECTVRRSRLLRTVSEIEALCETARPATSPFEDGVREESESFFLTSEDDRGSVLKAAVKLGYSLSPEDEERVWAAFLRVAEKKQSVSDRELDVLIATSALQVPPTYTLESYVINSGNRIASTSHVRLRRGETVEAGVCLGDGPIDASFLAVEQIVGTHYELDDFQIRAVTEGREAVGEAVVRLRAGGKVYAGRGISTDIVGASIHAYINALNKILYEENEA